MKTNSNAYELLRTRIRDTLEASPGLWDEIVLHSEEIELQKGDTLIDHLETNKGIYMVVKGAFECILQKDTHTKSLIWFFFDHTFDVIVGMGCCGIVNKTTYNVVAIERSTIIKFEKEKIDAWKHRYEAFDAFHKIELELWLFYYFEIRNQLFALPPIDFLDYLEANYPIISKRASSQKLAHFMGISPEWLSKLKKRRQPEVTQ